MVESVADPLTYYKNNIGGTLQLCESMAEAKVLNLIFSSSATVYGNPAFVPVTENFPTDAPTNPYGYSKLDAEKMLGDLVKSNATWSIGVLRYFNPVGAHPSGLIGEDPNGIPTNLLPYIAQVAVGKLTAVKVFGNDYSTPDGTGVRDYIHVQDLASGHLKALEFVECRTGLNTWNLGTGQGFSVLQMIRAFEKASGVRIPFDIVGRREGDVAECWSNPDKAFKELGWRAELGLPEMVADAWRWQFKNPNGYSDCRE